MKRRKRRSIRAAKFASDVKSANVLPAEGMGFSTMAMDQEYERHLHGWLAFARLMRWAVVAIILVLIFLAYMTL